MRWASVRLSYFPDALLFRGGVCGMIANFLPVAWNFMPRGMQLFADFAVRD